VRQSLRGRVMDDVGRPVVGALVFGASHGRRRGCGAEVAITGDDGAFEWAGCPWDGLGTTVFASAAGHVAAGAAWGAGDWADMVLERCVIVRGTVRDAAGDPVPFAEVRLRIASGSTDGDEEDDAPPPPGDPFDDAVVTGEDGAWEFGGIPPRREVHVAAFARRRRSAWRATPHAPGPGDVVALDLVLCESDPEVGAGRVVVGLVRDGDSRPVPGARLRGMALDARPGGGGNPAAGADGRFVGFLSPGVREGRVYRSTEVHAPGYAVAVVEVPDAVLDAIDRGEPPPLWEIVLRTGTSVAGRVLDADGAPVAGATVRVTEEAGGDRNPSWILDTRTDREGRFRFDDLDPDAAWFLLADDDLLVSTYVPLAGRLVDGETRTVDVPLPPRRELPIEVTVRGWEPGMTLGVDVIGRALDGPVAVVREYAGPHRLFVRDAADHPVGYLEFEVPAEAVAWQVAIGTARCGECAGAE
jgi:protocatechuate 3,4-dioxygenase beta subunit